MSKQKQERENERSYHLEGTRVKERVCVSVSAMSMYVCSACVYMEISAISI